MSNDRAGKGTAKGTETALAAAQSQSTQEEPSISSKVGRAVSEAALLGMYGILNGVLPLKHGRVACDLGTLALRGAIIAEEYNGGGKPLVADLPSVGEESSSASPS